MVYVFLAEGFEEIEALSVVDIIRRCGLSLQTVSISQNRQVTGAHGIPVLADRLFSETDFSDALALVLPGGLPGSDNLQNCEELKKLLIEGNEKGILLAAVCAAPKVLGAFGILKGKRATCYPGYEPELLGATPVEDRVAVDKNCITSRGAGTAADFAFAIAKALGAETEGVYRGMLYHL